MDLWIAVAMDESEIRQMQMGARRKLITKMVKMTPAQRLVATTSWQERQNGWFRITVETAYKVTGCKPVTL